ncbi:hypothetical protein PsAD2_02965 [Pseudovibrio axinellae]|uniref:Uncharacterized protein n=1 Tax=Pseudovibrio axinellae TaxID=989403 RepID=A0A165XEF6_9HYPH|nr:hypothetical protein [Pseudovibrio axinellae]KZL17629.1 hypothetical protein PsAD2_02965 [Pseudovibrio axinellae]SER45721.1 hypothetical protein SAMN05421798_110117 [Pseudovibrio axinellae]
MSCAIRIERIVSNFSNLGGGWREQRNYVLNRMPTAEYEWLDSKLLQAKDGPFYRFLGWDGRSHNKPEIARHSIDLAFAGARFDVPMKDGSKIAAWGQLWQVAGPQEPERIAVGLSTEEDLRGCFCFVGGYEVHAVEFQKLIDEYKERTGGVVYDYRTLQDAWHFRKCWNNDRKKVSYLNRKCEALKRQMVLQAVKKEAV